MSDLAEIMDVFFNHRPAAASVVAARTERLRFFEELLNKGTSHIRFCGKVYEVTVVESEKKQANPR